MSVLEFLLEIQGILGAILGAILGFILRGISEKGELYGFLHDEEVKINPKGKRLDDKGRTYANATNIENAHCGGCSLNIELLNEARFPRKIKIDKINFKIGKKLITADVFNIEICGTDYEKKRFITLEPNSSQKGKFYIETTKEDLIKIKDSDDALCPEEMTGYNPKRKKIEMELH